MPSIFACVAPVGSSEIFMLVVVLLVALRWLLIGVSAITTAKIELRQAELQTALRTFGDTIQRAVFACVGRVAVAKAVAVTVQLHF